MVVFFPMVPVLIIMICHLFLTPPRICLRSTFYKGIGSFNNKMHKGTVLHYNHNLVFELLVKSRKSYTFHLTINVTACQTSFDIDRMTTTNLDVQTSQLEDKERNSDHISKSKEFLIQKGKDESLPHQDHGYAWFIVLGKQKQSTAFKII